MPIDFVRAFSSVVLSLAIGGLGYWRGSLTRGGWLGALLVGTATAGFGGWTWGALVVVFFATSSALSHWRHDVKARRAGGTAAKGERRDFAQTMANGGAVSLLALVYAIDPQPIVFAAALGVLAAVTADTWATELGALSIGEPRLITTGKPVPTGTSGGVSLLGLAATVGGALLIGGVAWLMHWLVDGSQSLWVVPVALGGGVMGSLVDSMLGASVQRVHFCPQCQVETEQYTHTCGSLTEYCRGWHWLNNDWVNFVSSLLGALASVMIWAAIAA